MCYHRFPGRTGLYCERRKRNKKGLIVNRLLQEEHINIVTISQFVCTMYKAMLHHQYNQTHICTCIKLTCLSQRSTDHESTDIHSSLIHTFGNPSRAHTSYLIVLRNLIGKHGRALLSKFITVKLPVIMYRVHVLLKIPIPPINYINHYHLLVI